MKLYTQVLTESLRPGISLQDKILVLGSCFADEMGSKMKDAGFDVCVNPFGTLYNPASIVSALERLESGAPFTPQDCVQMGAGADLVCSFSHHTSFARKTAEAFLENANASLAQAAGFWANCNRVIITLGTAMVWKKDGLVVSNCLKRPAAEFTHEMLSVAEAKALKDRILNLCSGRVAIFTVSPIRHLSRGAHANTLSKATLHLSLEGESYFPAYEILQDELRDYRFYAEDLCHPSATAAGIIWEKFLEAAVPAAEHEQIRANEKAARRLAHRPVLHGE